MAVTVTATRPQAFDVAAILQPLGEAFDGGRLALVAEVGRLEVGLDGVRTLALASSSLAPSLVASAFSDRRRGADQ